MLKCFGNAQLSLAHSQLQVVSPRAQPHSRRRAGIGFDAGLGVTETARAGVAEAVLDGVGDGAPAWLLRLGVGGSKREDTGPAAFASAVAFASASASASASVFASADEGFPLFE